MAEASWWDNLKLGAAGVGDLAAGAVGVKTTWAADEYAQQAAQDPEKSASKEIVEAAKNGATAEQVAKMAKEAGVQATKDGALVKAAEKTVEQLGQKVIDGAKSGRRWVPWVVGGAVVLGVGIFAWRASK